MKTARGYVESLRLIANLTLGSGAVAYRTEPMHETGSPEAQVIVIGRQGDIEHQKKLAKALAGISG
jgi:4-hydroxybutyryl-CoA dehydratase/vinylacetyl-CoA-Delta-isomerase